ncbi:MAG: hypothetical protein HGA84_00200 [Syntrophobacteraceae bacterium]|nr:hypothetical protein [Syntrophobacteraceae bacterium]
MGLSLAAALISGFALMLLFPIASSAGDLDEIKQRGVLVHIGVPYANFVTGGGGGLDVELMQLFAHSLGVRYRYVSSTWQDVISDLTGSRSTMEGGDPRIVEPVPVKGDVIANGMPVLPDREKMFSFGVPTFLSQIWLPARHDSPSARLLPRVLQRRRGKTVTNPVRL